MTLENRGEKYFQRGRIFYKKAKFQKARRFFLTAATLNYQPSACHLYLGIMQLLEMDISEAFKTFQRVLASSESPGEVYYFVGKVFKAFDNPQEWKSNLKKAILSSRGEITRLLALEELEGQTDEKEWETLKTRAFSSYLIRTDIPHDEELLKKGIVARLEEDFEKAIEAFDEMISFYPDSFQGYVELAKTYLKMKKIHLAYNTLKRIQGHFKKRKMILRELAKTSFLLRKYRESIYYTRLLIRLSPKSPKLYFNLGLSLALTERHHEAIQAFKKAIELNPGFFDAYYNMGCIYQKNGFLEEALIHFNQALTLNPDHAETSYNLGLIYFESQDYFQSLSCFMKAHTVNPDLKEAYANFEVIRNLKTIENNVVKPLELNMASKISLAFTAVFLILSFFYLFRWI